MEQVVEEEGSRTQKSVFLSFSEAMKSLWTQLALLLGCLLRHPSTELDPPSITPPCESEPRAQLNLTSEQIHSLSWLIHQVNLPDMSDQSHQADPKRPQRTSDEMRGRSVIPLY